MLGAGWVGSGERTTRVRAGGRGRRRCSPTSTVARRTTRCSTAANSPVNPSAAQINPRPGSLLLGALVGEGSDLLGVVAHLGYVLGNLPQRPFRASRLIPSSRPGRR